MQCNQIGAITRIITHASSEMSHQGCIPDTFAVCINKLAIIFFTFKCSEAESVPLHFYCTFEGSTAESGSLSHFLYSQLSIIQTSPKMMKKKSGLSNNFIWISPWWPNCQYFIISIIISQPILTIGILRNSPMQAIKMTCKLNRSNSPLLM